MYIKPIKLTNETKLKEFEFKCLNSLVPNITHLYLNVKKIPLVFATFATLIRTPCNIMFWECQRIQHVWTNFTSKILTPQSKPTKDVNFQNSLVQHTRR